MKKFILMIALLISSQAGFTSSAQASQPLELFKDRTLNSLVTAAVMSEDGISVSPQSVCPSCNSSYTLGEAICRASGANVNCSGYSVGEAICRAGNASQNCATYTLGEAICRLGNGNQNCAGYKTGEAICRVSNAASNCAGYSIGEAVCRMYNLAGNCAGYRVYW